MGSISILDLAILLATLVVTATVGIAAGRRPKNAAEFLVGERAIPWWILLVSIVATETSSVTFLSVPGIAYSGDLTFLQLPLGYIVGRFAVVALLLPAYFAGRTLTTYEVLGRRFGAPVKRATSALFVVTRSVQDGLRLYLTALPLAALTGGSLASAVVAMGVVTILYSIVGGMRAVVWADVVQFVIYVGGGVLALAVALRDVPGGWHAAFELARAHGKLRIFDFAFAADRPFLFWSGLIGGAFLTLGTHGVDQMIVQRCLSARSRREASLALALSGLVVFVQFTLFLALGLALYAWFGATPRASSPPTASDAVFTTFIVERLSRVPGALGVILGALFAVSMSVLSSSLNSSSGALVNDLLPRSPTAGVPLKRMRLAMLLFGVVQVTIGLLGPRFHGAVVFQVLRIASFTTGVTLGLFFLARAAPRANGRAALAALAIGIAGMSVLWWLRPQAFPWFACIGSLGTCAVGALLATTRWGGGGEVSSLRDSLPAK